MSKTSRKRKAVLKVMEALPPMTRCRNKRDGDLYVMGVRFGLVGFWVMNLTECKKGVVDARTILHTFRKEGSNGAAATAA